MAIPEIMGDLRDRYEALDTEIDIHIKWLESLTGRSDRAEILLCLLRRLKVFAAGHFKTFYDGFTGGDFTESPRYPPEHVLDTILDQIADDLDVIRRAAADDIIATGNTDNRQALTRADELARQALGPAGKLGLTHAKVVNYFQRSAANRVIPYDGNPRKIEFESYSQDQETPTDLIALFGVPFTTVQVLRDFLATPHEVGHFVFWNGVIDKQPIWIRLRQEIDNDENIPDWVKPWLEEIFADVYGALVAGPVIAWSFLQMQLLDSQVDFIQDDGVHPAPAVRPYVYTEVLRRSGMNAWADSLEADWQIRLANRGNPSHIMLQSGDLSGFLAPIVSGLISFLGFYQVPLLDARKAMNQVVDKVYRLLVGENLEFSSTWWGQIPYAGLAPQNLDQLYPTFEKHFSSLEVTPSRAPENCASDTIYTNWKQELAAKLIQTNFQVPGCEGEPGCSEDDKRPCWCAEWVADGWVTRGPQGEH